MEQVQKIEGERAYEEMRRNVERGSQPLMPSQFPSHDGPERDYGPSRSSLFPLWSGLFLCGHCLRGVVVDVDLIACPLYPLCLRRMGE